MGLGAPRQWSRAMARDMEAIVSVKCRAWALLFVEFILDRQKQLLKKFFFNCDTIRGIARHLPVKFSSSGSRYYGRSPYSVQLN